MIDPSAIRLGTADESMSIARLIETRMLIQANSGAGKSWALRRLLEQACAHVQCIVVDVEDEFHTLREAYDFALAGPGGDCAATIDTAHQLATNLLELGVSCVVNISELSLADRMRFVQLFVDAMMVAPHRLWHPVIVVIDEAHVFCPEGYRPTLRKKSDEEPRRTSADSVIDLMTRGRKRGFCGVLATQRLSKLNKDAAAECNNKLVGRCVQDIDMQRAAQELGLGRKDMAYLRSLVPGQFFTFGPAFFTQEVSRIHVGEVFTTHHRAGANAVRTTPARARVLEVLGKLLRTVPAVAAEPTGADDNDKLRIADLEAKLAAIRPYPHDALTAVSGALAHAAKLTEDLASTLHTATTSLQEATTVSRPAAQPATMRTLPDDYDDYDPAPGDETGPKRLERLFLTVLAQRGPLSKSKVLLFADYAPSGKMTGTFASLNRLGWTEYVDGLVRITDAGRKALGRYEPLPNGAALRKQVLEGDRLSSQAKRVLQVLITAYPGDKRKNDILHDVNLKPSGKTSEAFAQLIKLGYATNAGRMALRASSNLF